MGVVGSTNRTELAMYYGVCRATLTKWIDNVPELGIKKGCRTINPAAARRIKEYFGDPLMDTEIKRP